MGRSRAQWSVFDDAKDLSVADIEHFVRGLRKNIVSIEGDSLKLEMLMKSRHRPAAKQ